MSTSELSLPIPIKAVTSTDKILTIGFPYHGKSVCEHHNGAELNRYLEGHPELPKYAALNYAATPFAVRLHNAPADQPAWNHYFVYDQQVMDWDGAQGVFPVMPSSTQDNDYCELGVPLTVGNKVLKLKVFSTQRKGEIRIVGVTNKRSRYLNYSYQLPTSRFAVVEQRAGRTLVMSLDEIYTAQAAQNYAATTMRCHGFYANKALLSLGIHQIDHADEIESDSEHTYLGGTLYNVECAHARYQGYVPLVFFEISTLLPELDAVRLTVLSDFKQTEGTIQRESTPIGEEGRPLDDVVQTLSVTNAVLAKFYDKLGRIKTIYGDFYYNTYKQRKTPQWHYLDMVEARITHRLDNHSLSLDYAAQASLSTDTDDLTQGQWQATLNGQEIEKGKFKYEDTFNDRLWVRAPFAGSEMRYLTLPNFGWWYSSTSYQVAAQLCTISSLHNGNNVSLYAVFENYPFYPRKKQIHCVGVLSAFGLNQELVHFTDTVQADDPRYSYPNQQGNFHYMAGYVGARTRGVVHPITGELAIASVNYPISFINFR